MGKKVIVVVECEQEDVKKGKPVKSNGGLPKECKKCDNTPCKEELELLVEQGVEIEGHCIHAANAELNEQKPKPKPKSKRAKKKKAK